MRDGQLLSALGDRLTVIKCKYSVKECCNLMLRLSHSTETSMRDLVD